MDLLLRTSRVGDLVPRRLTATGRARRLEATAFVLPGSGALGEYLGELDQHGDAFAEWDGRVVVTEPDGRSEHQVVIVDRYGQVYETISALDPAALPSAEALNEWFRFLATACPECGVIDDPRPRAWTP
jgi:hypothetical protein